MNDTQDLLSACEAVAPHTVCAGGSYTANSLLYAVQALERNIREHTHRARPYHGTRYDDCMTADDPSPNPPTGGPVSATGLTLVLLSQISIQLGAATAMSLFPVLGPIGTVSVRLVFSALLLAVILRPRLRGLTKEAWLAAVFLGLTLTAMNNLIYLSFERLPLGIAVTIEILGPLALAVALTRTLSAWLLAGLALIGVWLLTGGSFAGTHLDPLGVLFAALAGLAWVGYILFSRTTARLFRRADGLAVAMMVAAVCAVPIGAVAIPDLSALTSLTLIGIGFAVAALSSALPYALEQLSLRMLPATAFAMLMSVSPAMAAVVGFAVLGQSLTTTDLIGMALVTVATAIAMRQSRASGST